MRKTLMLALTAGMCSMGYSDSLDDMAKPAYTERGELVRPEDFREWVFAGASLGLSYSKDDSAAADLFHHVYVQPEAYRQYRDTGTFPEKTMLVMENYTAGSKEANTAAGKVEGEQPFGNLNGRFEDAHTGIEVALKDSARFEEGWAYFVFTVPGQPMKESAKAFPKSMCWDCHRAHAADDNVFVQFYPVLREHFEARQAARGGAPASGDAAKPENAPGR